MIHFLKGQLSCKAIQSPKGAYWVVEVNGVGYEIATHGKAVSAGPTIGENVTVFTTLIVREDLHMLVGFLNREERDLLNILQQASGVGVKVALALMEALTVPEIAQAILSEDHKRLTAAKGVGPKLAQKMVLELKEKMTAWRNSAFEEFSTLHTLESTGIQTARPYCKEEAFLEAEAVILSLGYSGEEAAASLKWVWEQQSSDKQESLSAESVLHMALRALSKQSG